MVEDNPKAETEICKIKIKWNLQMHNCAISLQLWHYGLIFNAEVQYIIGHGPNKCFGIQPFLGQTFDISEWLDFKFNVLVWFWDQPKLDMTTAQ